MEFLKQYEILYKKAKTDLKVSKNLLEDIENGDEDLDLETVMFHLQQCAEKLLKALLAFHKFHFTKTHDIEKLLSLLKQNSIDFSNDIEVLINLTDYAVEGRYAIIHDDMEDAQSYIELLEIFLEFVRESIYD